MIYNDFYFVKSWFYILRGGSSQGPKSIIQMVYIRTEFMIRCPGYCQTKLYQFLIIPEFASRMADIQCLKGIFFVSKQ